MNEYLCFKFKKMQYSAVYSFSPPFWMWLSNYLTKKLPPEKKVKPRRLPFILPGERPRVDRDGSSETGSRQRAPVLFYQTFSDINGG